LGSPSILVNNAAHSIGDDHQTLNAQRLDAHYSVNIRGTMLLSVEFARRYAGRSARRIINLTSGQSLGPMPGELSYVASKGAIDAFTVTLSAELAARGVTVNAVDPGPTDTGWMTEDLRRDLAEGVILSPPRIDWNRSVHFASNIRVLANDPKVDYQSNTRNQLYEHHQKFSCP
jgi:3-oxoacyl-[acyl-carrier protein] reductase